MALSYAKSCLIGALLECIVYGLYVTVFSQTLLILRRKLIPGVVSIYLTATSLILFFLITLRLVLDNKAAVEAFSDDPMTPNAAEIYYTHFGEGAMFRTGTYIALTIIADLFIVYRVFAIWSRSIIATLGPFLLAVADIITGALFLQVIRHLEVGASPDGNPIASRALLFYGFTLCLNVICTILISLRLFIQQRQTADANMSSVNLQNTMIIVIESASIYSVFTILMLVTTAISSNVQYCFLSMMPGIVGLAFSLIIVRVGSGISPDSTASSGPGSHLRFGGVSRSRFTTTTSFTERSRVETMIGAGGDRVLRGEKGDGCGIRLGSGAGVRGVDVSNVKVRCLEGDMMGDGSEERVGEENGGV